VILGPLSWYGQVSCLRKFGREGTLTELLDGLLGSFLFQFVILVVTSLDEQVFVSLLIAKIFS
jgi:hypothetical protein